MPVHNTSTARWIKNPSESGVFVQMAQNTESHNVDVCYRYGSYHILTKINREIFWKILWPLKFEIWIWKFDR